MKLLGLTAGLILFILLFFPVGKTYSLDNFGNKRSGHCKDLYAEIVA